MRSEKQQTIYIANNIFDLFSKLVFKIVKVITLTIKLAQTWYIVVLFECCEVHISARQSVTSAEG